MRTSVRALLLPMFLLLGGCSSSLFESLPAGTVSTCDPALPGPWTVISADSAAPNSLPRSLEIAADCRTVFDEGQPKPVKANFVHSRAGNFVEALNDSGDLDCIGENRSHCGHFLLRYELVGSQLRLYMPDHARIAEALEHGQIQGYQPPPPDDPPQGQEPVYRNFVAGDPEQIARVLAQHPEFFVAEPTTVLERGHAAANPSAAPKPAPPTTQPEARGQ